jgi:hypothetical protein
MTEVSDSPAMTEGNAVNQLNSPDWLSDSQMEMVFFIERFHAMQGETPTDEIMNKRFALAPNELAEFKTHPLVAKSMAFRGITYPALADLLNERQMAAVAVMTNFIDKRSDEKKLRDIGITTREWATWMLDENFQKYLSTRSERMLVGAQHEAHLGLIKGMRNGNVASVKLFNEMTGRYNPEADNQVNVKLLLHSFIEVLQRHIKDPIQLHGIAGELMQIASGSVMGIGMGAPSGRSAPSPIAQKVITMKGEV